MTLIARTDEWLGLKLFHPPIIRFCQWTGYTQHRLHRDMWFAAGLYITWRSVQDGDHWLWTVMLLAGCLILGLRAALLPATWPESGTRWFRVAMWCVLALELPAAVLAGKWLNLADTVWLLTAEYAATITTIPPREKKARTSARRATVSS
ncbi:hypothetical protein [Pelagerythrobacter aerophilus]|uniref:Uncharacterized protein n=1 Tax=Pelagerythrobacter aerophilus TaxID=2306995 RepID=A0A418NJK2_9SPHN|nr:hypothetical protein [Pelagerythrobacter aerophilus]RIV79537.1 hypothetical protein D2V04_06085 [Pelagerythrobacter aerophilus]